VVAPCSFEETLGLVVEEVPSSIVDGLLGPLIGLGVTFVEQLVVLRRQFLRFAVSKFHKKIMITRQR
jgi:hypothetical protein